MRSPRPTKSRRYGIVVVGRAAHEDATLQPFEHFLPLETSQVEVEAHNLVNVAVRGVFGVELADELIGAVWVESALQAANAAAVVARGLEIGGGQDGAKLLHVRCLGGHGVSGEKHMSDIAGFEERMVIHL